MTARARAALIPLVFSLLTASGCASPSPSQAGTPVSVYYVAALDAGSPVIMPETAYCPDGTDASGFALDRLMSAPASHGLRRPFPDGVKILGVEISDGIAHVDFSGEYSALSGFELTLANACLTMTLTSLPGIDGVILLCEREPVITGRDSDVLRAEDFMLSSLRVESAERVFTRYYPDADLKYALPETRPVLLREDRAPEWCLMEELISGPRGEGKLPAMPPGTSLISVELEGRVCSVNLSGEFISMAQGDIRSARMTLVCITGTLTGLSSVSSVRLLVDGSPIDSYFGLDTSSPLKRDPFLPGRTGAPGRDAELFYPDKAGHGLVPVTVWVEYGAESLGPEKAALERLFSSAPPVGLSQACPTTTRMLGLTKDGGVYTLDLSASFAKTAPPLGPELSLQAIVHTLAQFDRNARVIITVDGQALDRYFSIELSEPLTAGSEYLWP